MTAATKLSREWQKPSGGWGWRFEVKNKKLLCHRNEKKCSNGKSHKKLWFYELFMSNTIKIPSLRFSSSKLARTKREYELVHIINQKNCHFTLELGAVYQTHSIVTGKRRGGFCRWQLCFIVVIMRSHSSHYQAGGFHFSAPKAERGAQKRIKQKSSSVCVGFSRWEPEIYLPFLRGVAVHGKSLKWCGNEIFLWSIEKF